jgi:uncharacterized protein
MRSPATELSIPSMLKRSLAAVLALLTVPAFAQLANVQPNAPTSPSFDCAKARGRVEKMICAEGALASLDRRIADLYAVALAQTTDQGDAKRDQRRWLGDRDDCKDVACVERSYRERLTALTTLTGRFTVEEAQAICDAFVQPESRARMLESTAGAQDINNDGKPERRSECAGGTANIPCVEYFDADDQPLRIAPQGFEWITYSALGRATFRVDGRTFTYYASDAALEQPAFISFVTPTNRDMRVCDFDTIIGSAVTQGSDDVCAAVESMDTAIEPAELATVTDPGAYATGRRDTRARALGKSDIDNDGLEESLIEYAYSSGAGRGCEINYFELLGEDGRSLATNSNAAAVRELQGLGPAGADGRNCGLVTNRLFRFADKIYLESNAGDAPGLPHEVRILRGDAVATVCTFERQVRTKVKTLY